MSFWPAGFWPAGFWPSGFWPEGSSNPDTPTEIPFWAVVGLVIDGLSGGIQSVMLPLGVGNLTPTQLKTGDTAPSRVVQLQDAQGRPFVLGSSATVAYRLKRRASTDPDPDVSGAATVVCRNPAIVRFDFADPLPVAGNYYEEWTVTDGANVATFPGDGFVSVTITDTLG